MPTPVSDSSLPPAKAPAPQRRVFYIAGFDPRGAQFYHRLYADNAALQSDLHARAHPEAHGTAPGRQAFSVGPLEADARFDANWVVHARAVGDAGTGGDATAPTSTRYTYLGWDDLARANTPRGVVPALKAVVAFQWALWTSRSITGAWTHSRRFFGSLITALLWLLLVVGCAGLLAVGLGTVANGLGTPPAWAWALGAAAALALLYGGWRLALRWRFVWLLHALHYYLRWGLGLAPELDARLDNFAQAIAQDIHERQLAGDRSEVLMVGHCMGSSLIVVILDKVLRALEAPASGSAGAAPPIKLLTLANVIPMVTLVKHTDHVARALKAVAKRQLPWLDYTSPHDPLCYALVDCVAVSGAAPPAGSPRVTYRPRSVRFDKMFHPAAYAALKKDPFRIHFQYLMASALPVDNDFFTLTAGPWPLERWI